MAWVKGLVSPEELDWIKSFGYEVVKQSKIRNGHFMVVVWIESDVMDVLNAGVG